MAECPTRFKYLLAPASIYFLTLPFARAQLIAERIGSLPGKASISLTAVSPDGRHIANVLRNSQGKDDLYLDGHIRATHASIAFLEFNRNGSHLAALAHDPDVDSILLDGSTVAVLNRTERSWDHTIGTSRWIRDVDIPFPPWSFSPDGGRIAYASFADGKYALVTDGKRGKSYAQIKQWVFSNNSARFAYAAAAQPKAEWFAVIDSQESPTPLDGRKIALEDSSDLPRLITFSQDARHVAYPGRSPAGGAFAVIDGTAQEEFRQVDPVNFSHDGNHVAYFARTQENQGVVVWDGKKSDWWFEIRCGPHFTPADDHLLYWADRNTAPIEGRRAVRVDVFSVEDNVASPTNDSVEQCLYSPDGKSRALIQSIVIGGSKGDGTFPRSYNVYLNAKRLTIRDEWAISGLTFSSDSSHLAYAAYYNGQWRVDTEKSPGPYYQKVGPPLFSPDGSHLAYSAQTATGWFMIVDGKPLAEGATVSPLLPAPFVTAGDLSKTAPQTYDFTPDGRLHFISATPDGLYRKTWTP